MFDTRLVHVCLAGVKCSSLCKIKAKPRILSLGRSEVLGCLLNQLSGVCVQKGHTFYVLYARHWPKRP